MRDQEIIKLMKEKEVEYVDLRFTDPRGKLHHLTMDGKMVDEKMLNEGVFFDGSSIAGWKSIHESDMLLNCLLYTSPSPRDGLLSRMPSSA